MEPMNPPIAHPPTGGDALLDSDAEVRYALLRSVGEECQSEEELRNLLRKKPHPICYDGFEPSGRMHIAQGIYKAINVNKCIAAGCDFVFWVADWFALMNDKMGGELERIRTVGKYFVEVWKVSGMNITGEPTPPATYPFGVEDKHRLNVLPNYSPTDETRRDRVQFLWSSEWINRNAKEYWGIVLDISRRTSLSRITKCCQIMGRKEGGLTAAQILYPLMQCADIFFLKADVCQLGLDQRKVNMLAREYCDHIKRKLKPIILSHHMLQGLLEERDEDGNLQKMSKSNPDSAIFMEDSRDEIARKIMNAYCPSGQEVENPCLEYAKYIVYGYGRILLGFQSYEQLLDAYVSFAISPEQLKHDLIEQLDDIIRPVREHFQTNEEAKLLLDQVKRYRTDATMKKKAEENTGELAQDVESVTEGAGETTNKNVLSSSSAFHHGQHIVAWLYPTMQLTLDEANALCQGFHESLSPQRGGLPGAKGTLFLADWSGLAAKSIQGAELQDIQMVLQYNVCLIRAMGLPESVNIVLQSEYILQQPDAYWLGVIQQGRQHSLDTIISYGENIDHAGQVLAVLMHLNEIKMLGVTQVISPGAFGCSLHASFHLRKFTYPASVHVPSCPEAIPFLCDPSSSVLNSGGPTIQTSMDAVLLCHDTEAEIKRKIKRAYGPPAEVEGNPLLLLATLCMAWSAEGSESVTLNSTVSQDKIGEVIHAGWTVPRATENGGPMIFQKYNELVDAYRSGQLHPADLKAAIQKEIMYRTRNVRTYLESADMKQRYTNALKVLAKKISKTV